MTVTLDPPTKVAPRHDLTLDEGMGILTAPIVTQATSTATFGPRSGGTFADDATVGTLAWTSPSNAAASDNTYATAGSGVASHYLKATNFGFAIPAGATINGIVVEVEKNGNATDGLIKLVKGGTIGGTNHSAGVWPPADAYSTHGASNDLWGLTLAPSDINASTFGVAISFSGGGAGGIGNIDHIRITVHYTPAVVPASDAVLYANRTAQLTDKGHFRQDTGEALMVP